jgi:hypothetical protein
LSAGGILNNRFLGNPNFDTRTVGGDILVVAGNAVLSGMSWTAMVDDRTISHHDLDDHHSTTRGTAWKPEPSPPPPRPAPPYPPHPWFHWLPAPLPGCWIVNVNLFQNSMSAGATIAVLGGTLDWIGGGQNTFAGAQSQYTIGSQMFVGESNAVQGRRGGGGARG